VQEPITGLVGGSQIVLSTVEFDDEHSFEANEVREVRSDRNLPPETESVELLATQVVPQETLGIG